MNYHWHPAAIAEFDAALDYYLLNAGPTISRDFASATLRAIELLLEHPLIGTATRQGTRRLVLQGFPFDLVYRLQGGMVTVLALASHNRRPGYWAGRR